MWSPCKKVATLQYSTSTVATLLYLSFTCITTYEYTATQCILFTDKDPEEDSFQKFLETSAASAVKRTQS